MLLTLFPQEDSEEISFPVIEGQAWDESLGVSEDEIMHYAKKIKDNEAPGPDGIPGKIIKIASGVLTQQMAHIFTRCLREGYFPREWKETTFVLLQKAGKPKNSPSAYRPICLLGEVGKLLERIIAGRLVVHLANTEGCSLSPEQYEFIQGRSTIDAIVSLKNLKEELIRERGIALAVSLALQTLLIQSLGERLPRPSGKRIFPHTFIKELLRRTLYIIREGEGKEREVLSHSRDAPRFGARPALLERGIRCGPGSSSSIWLWHYRIR